MNAERYAEIKQVFLRACELEGDARADYIDSECGDDATLKQEVLSLLEHHSSQTITGGLSDTNIDLQRPGPSGDASGWVGRRIGKYVVSRVIETGGMGAVLLGHDETIERRVAIKVLHDELAGDETSRERFLTEARAAGRLNHPNVVTIYEVGADSGDFYIVMEYVEGGSSADHVERFGDFSPQEATRLVGEACRGLAAAHDAGLVHRDVKPANLLLTQDKTVKVSDFGVAKVAGGKSMSLTFDGQLVGTPNYMSPEQCEGAHVDPRSDLYSLGATYYTLLTGLMPYHEQDSLIALINAHCNADPPDPRKDNPHIPVACAEIIRRAMAKDPSDRFQTAEEMREALALALDPSTPIHGVASAAGEPARDLTKPVRRRWLWASAVAFVTLAVGSAISSLIPRDPERSPQAGVVAAPPIQDAEPIRIGLLHSLSGTMARSEEVIVDAYLLAIDEINANGGVLGRTIKPIVVDGQSDEHVFAQQAKELIDEEGVCTIFGCCTSASRKAVVDVVESADHLLVYPVNHEGLESSPNVIYLGGDPAQTVIPCARWAYAFGQKRRFFLVGSDYVFPRVVIEMLKDQLASMGAEVVGEGYIALGSTDVGPLIDEIETAEPDAIINMISGDSQIAFVRRLRDRGVEATQFSTGIGEQELRSIRIGPLVGDYSIGTYFQSLRSEDNREFVQNFRKRFGAQRVVNAAMETAYAAVYLWARGVEKGQDLRPTAIRDAMLGREFDAPGGKIRIDPQTQYAYRRSYIGRVQPTGQFRIAWQSPEPIPPDPYPNSRPRESWEALLQELRAGWGGQWSAP